MSKIYVLHGHWDTIESRGATVVGVSFDKDKMIDALGDIATDKGRKYCKLNETDLKIEQEDTIFEMHDMESGGFLGFYIVEQEIE